MNYTSIEQSKALIEAGLNPETADCCWIISRDNCKQDPFELAKNENTLWLYPIDKIRGNLSDYMLPCWSTGALINILPSEIHTGETKDFTFQLRLGKTKTEFWISYKFQISGSRGTFITFKADKGTYICFNTAIDKCDMADCVYKMVMFCLEKGFIKKEEPCE